MNIFDIEVGFVVTCVIIVATRKEIKDINRVHYDIDYFNLTFLIVVYERVRFLPLDVFIVDDGADGREEDEVTLTKK